MYSNELTDFISAARATHSYTDQQIADYFVRIMRLVSPDGVRVMVGVLRDNRPQVMMALLRAGIIGSAPSAPDTPDAPIDDGADDKWG